MADLNKQSLEMWNAMKPMVDREIDQQTKGAVQRRKAKVTTAPSLVTKKIGVTEPFGDQYFIPYDAKVAGAKVGDVVWVEYMYGASNAFASMFAKAVEDPRFCYATLSSAGWYRVMDVNAALATASKFSVATIVDINIGTEYWATTNSTHKISLHGVYNNASFIGEESKSNAVMLVSKIRYTYDSSGNGHIDIYYTGSSGNPVWCTFTVHTPYTYQHWFSANNLTSVADAPSGETVLTTYNFAANGDNNFKTISVSKTTTSGAFAVTEASVNTNSRCIATPQYFSATSAIAWFVMLQPLNGALNVYIRDASGNVPANGTRIDLDILIDNR